MINMPIQTIVMDIIEMIVVALCVTMIIAWGIILPIL